MGSEYSPPTANLTIYNNSNYTSSDETLTLAEANSLYLKLTGGTETGFVNFTSGLQSTTVRTTGNLAVGTSVLGNISCLVNGHVMGNSIVATSYTAPAFIPNGNQGALLGWNRSAGTAEMNLVNVVPSSGYRYSAPFEFSSYIISSNTYTTFGKLSGLGLSVGNVNPSANLHVAGTGYITSTLTTDGITYAKSGIDFSSGASGHLGVDGAMYKFGEPYIAVDNILYISDTSGNPKCTFRTDTGRVGIGTTNPAYPFEVVGQNTSSQYSNPSSGKYFSRNASITSMGTVNTFNCSIMTTGSIWINSLSGDSLDNSFASGNSDRRIKTDIKEIETTEALSKIRELKPVYYKYIDRDNDKVENIGFIAQEVKEVIPIAVDGTKENFIPNVFKFGKWYSIRCANGLEGDSISESPLYKNFINFDAPHGLTGTGKIQVVLQKDNKEEEKEEWQYKVFNELILEVSRITDKTETIFIYGSWVTNFHILTEKPINIMAVSAIKELDKKITRIMKYLNLEE